MRAADVQDVPTKRVHDMQDPSEDSTTAAVQSVKPLSFSRLPPVLCWDRYEILEFLGAGGMGKVFKARDPRLGRYVALKFILYDDPELVRRLTVEARAQARIQHERICKVYEVGEVEGHPYVAMQLIEGESLRGAKWRMTLEQKVAIVADVAEALHAAHRIGLIHRDIKPANIMVERDEDGAYRPYILDFGLAREIAESEPVASEVIEGTMWYMAPEQARGEIHRVDRRADVYSLGATFYEMLTGRPPMWRAAMTGVAGFDSGEVAPEPLRSIDSRIPVDLETIIMKCLERDPSRRYDSAKALAEDLGRYLDDEPIRARRATLAYVALKRARKNKALVASITALLVCVLWLGSAALRARLSAGEQAETARRLGQHVTEMELFLRTAHVLPLHDIGRERAIIRTRMDALAAQLEEGDSLSEGPLRYALARGHLALREHKKALAQLQKAWESGYRIAELELAMGLALGELYKQGIEETHRIADKDLRDARKRELGDERLAPALRHLAASNRADAEAPLYIEALIASYLKEHDVALDKARQAFERSPWLYEAKKLEGDILRERGDERCEAGKLDEALAFYERAHAAYTVTAGVARSEPSVYEAEASLGLQRMEAYRLGGRNPAEVFEQVLTACDKALASDPASAAAYSIKALAYLRLAIHKLANGGDPTPELKAGIETGTQAIQRSPVDAVTLDTVGNIHTVAGQYKIMQGADPRDSIREGVRLYEAALRINSSFAWAWNDLGGALSTMGAYEMARGLDPRASLKKAVEAYEAAIRHNKMYLYPHVNACDAYGRLGKYEAEHGLDPTSSLGRAFEACANAIRINPSFWGAYTNLGWAFVTRAQHEVDLGRYASLERAEASCKRAVELSRTDTESYQCLARAYWLMAVNELRQQGSPLPALEEGRRAVRTLIELAANDAQPHLLSGLLELVAARHAMQSQGGGASPEASFTSAAEALAAAERLNPRNADVLSAVAELNLRRAEHASLAPVKDARRAAEWITQGITAAEASLAVSPASPRTLVTLGALSCAQARGAATPERRRQAARPAVDVFRRALAENAFLEADIRPLLKEAEELARDL